MQTLVVRDEVDIVDAQLAYHLNAGVDFVIASDHESRDGTTEILQAYERDGVLRRLAVSGPVRESDWRTTMARLAAAEHGADWVINTDADEFWMPVTGTLKDALAAVPERFGIVAALSRHFVPRPETGELFSERMTVRVSAQSPLNDPTSPFRPHAKVAHRGDPGIVVGFGGHLVRETALIRLPGLYPADILHFPFRSMSQYERKGVRRAHSDKRMGQYVKAFEAREAGRLADAFEAMLVDDLRLERGQGSGSLTVDVRLRDALRRLRPPGDIPRVSPQGFALPLAGVPPVPAVPSTDVARIGELAALLEADVVRAWRTADGLAARLGACEQSLGRTWRRRRRQRSAGGAGAGVR